MKRSRRMSKHTPGPWKWTLSGDPRDMYQLEGNIKYADMNPILVAYDCGCQADKETDRCPIGPDPADMKIIAAVPDLLAACKAALEMCSFPIGTAWVKEQLQNAISKAQDLPKFKDIIGLYADDKNEESQES